MSKGNPILKTEEEIEKIRTSCLLVSATITEVGKNIREGVTTKQLDKIAETFILDHGAKPAFKGYVPAPSMTPFPGTLCTSLNDVVVHGIPSNEVILKEGDIISIDCGVLLNDYYGDSAYTFGVGEISAEKEKLLRVTKESLYKAIENSIVGKRLGDIGYAVQSHVQSYNFSIVKDMVGHGIGKDLHEPPEVCNYGNRGQGKSLTANLVIAIEPMVNVGKAGITVDKDGWTIRTIDRKASAHFEHTIVVRQGKAEILSTFADIEKLTNITIYG